MTEAAADNPKEIVQWRPGAVPIAVVMISLNEAHHMSAVLDNLEGFASEVFLVDSFSSDATVEIAVSRGVNVVQRRFRNFGDQWNFAVRALPITSPWTMKLDPDERLTDELKSSIASRIEGGKVQGLTLNRRLHFLGRKLPARQKVARVWRTGRCRFSDVVVNEHAIIEGKVETADGELEHHDSPNLHHWYQKQNNYTTAEATSFYEKLALADKPKLFGSSMQRRMLLKKHLRNIPFRYQLLFLHHYFAQGAWRGGRAGYIWARLRVDVFRMIEVKLIEMRRLGTTYRSTPPVLGAPHPRAIQVDGKDRLIASD
ncbi:glycosyltransferase family 2 protein [Mesorhizobium prunaredense]|nr:glycosyltransferase family 2 protein [Mesorhizobium prunaredense]